MASVTNRELFKKVFGIYATELWAKPEKDFLEWCECEAKVNVVDNPEDSPEYKAFAQAHECCGGCVD